MCENYTLGHILENNNGQFVSKVLDHIRDWTIAKQVETKELINMEMVPAEGCSYRLALADKRSTPNIITSGDAYAPYYSSLLIPASFRMDTIDKIQFEEKLLPLFSGGTIFRTYLGENIPSNKTTLDFIKLVSRSKIPYFDLTSTYSVCPTEKKVIKGITTTCPTCASTTEVYSRVVGYYREISKYNVGKFREFSDRRYSNIGSIQNVDV
jgi:ribonucleoside-triphosphate reductase